MPESLLIVNLKMMLRPDDAAQYTDAIVHHLATTPLNAELVLCPDFLSLARVRSMIESTQLTLGAQDLFWEERGAYTGEISAQDLVGFGCRYVLIGHSERRQYLGETDAMVGLKVTAALAAGLAPVVCVGAHPGKLENSIEQDIERQLAQAFAHVRVGNPHRLVVAYEPTASIGTGHVESPPRIAQIRSLIISCLREHLPDSFVRTQVRIIYGGSVSPRNIQLLRGSGVDGFLVGGAARTAELLAEFFPVFSR